MTGDQLRHAFVIWLAEIGVAGFNYFVLIRRVYEPRVGELRGHRIGMTTRIACILGFAWLLLTLDSSFTTLDQLYTGLFWLALILVFEWGGSFLIRRPVHEILIGWHVRRGYMWPYVLLTYLLAPLLVGSLIRI